jgi:hypothetical protein
VSDEYLERYKDNDSIPSPAFNAMISNFDDNLGKLLRYLKRNELEHNTILVYMTDNGTSAGVQIKDDKIVQGYNAGMRGRKGSMYEGGHRVPCFIRWPQGEIQAGRDIAIALCPVQEPITMLRTHDMHMDKGNNLVPWNHQQIRQGMKSNGWYAVNVLEAGVYEFTLMRWPPESGGGLLAGLPGKPAVAGTTISPQGPGKKLDLKMAGISICKKKDEQSISEGAGTGITFEMPVRAGHHKLRAWFVDGEGESFGAYYVKVEKK